MFIPVLCAIVGLLGVFVGGIIDHICPRSESKIALIVLACGGCIIVSSLLLLCVSALIAGYVEEKLKPSIEGVRKAFNDEQNSQQQQSTATTANEQEVPEGDFNESTQSLPKVVLY